MARPWPGDSRSLLLFSRKRKGKQHKHMLLSSKNADSWRGEGGPNQRKEGGKHFHFNVVSVCKSPGMESTLMYQAFTLQLSPANSSSLHTRLSPGSSCHLQTPRQTPCRKLLSPVNFSGCLKKSFSSLGEAEGLGTSLSPPGTA